MKADGREAAAFSRASVLPAIQTRGDVLKVSPRSSEDIAAPKVNRVAVLKPTPPRQSSTSPRAALTGVSHILQQEGGKAFVTLAESLTCTAEHNRFIGVHSAEDKRSAFECVTIPPITVWSFLSGLSQMVPIATMEHWYATACLIDRLCIYTNTPLTPWNIHRIILVSFTVALSEGSRNNYLSTIARAGGVSIQDMHDMVATFESYHIAETVSRRHMKKIAQFLSKPVPLCKRLFEMRGGSVATVLGMLSLSSSRCKLFAAKSFGDLHVSVDQEDTSSGTSCVTSGSANSNSSRTALTSPTHQTASGTPTSGRMTVRQLSPTYSRTTDRAAALLSSAEEGKSA